MHENCALQSMNYLHHHKIKIEYQSPTGSTTEQEIIERFPAFSLFSDGTAGKFMLVLLVLAGIAGGSAYFWLKMREKQREAEENKPDPDADYREDEEEIVLPDEPDVGAGAEADEDAARRAYQTSDGYEE